MPNFGKSDFFYKNLAPGLVAARKPTLRGIKVLVEPLETKNFFEIRVNGHGDIRV